MAGDNPLAKYRAYRTCARCMVLFVARSPLALFCGERCRMDLTRDPQPMPHDRDGGLADAAFVDDSAYLMFVGVVSGR